MSSIPTIDASKGFVALPASIMDLEMSLGAFRVLVELCNLACIRGYSWPGQDQLAEKIGRSKASVSGYVKELRELGLVETISQTMASGYNYRCKYLVTFWADWIASRKEKRVTRKPAANDDQPTERSVQPADRPSSKKNNIHKTQTDEPARRLAAVVNDVDKAWKDLMDRSGHFRHAPPEGLEQFTARLLRKNPHFDPLPQSQLEALLKDVWAGRGVTVSADTITEQASLLVAQKCSSEGAARLKATIDYGWQPHWRKPPTKDQFISFVLRSIPNVLVTNKLEEIRCALKTWKNEENRLPTAA